MTLPSPASGSELTYDQAIKELSTILEELERSSVDVDMLASKVARGSELIDFCKSRLKKVEEEVKTVIEHIEDTTPNNSE